MKWNDLWDTGFVSRISLPLEHSATYLFCVVVHVRWTLCLRRKFECAYLIKNHKNNPLFRYNKLGFRCFELNVFSHCFDLKDLNLNKHFERLRRDSLFALQLTISDQMSEMLRDEACIICSCCHKMVIASLNLFVLLSADCYIAIKHSFGYENLVTEVRIILASGLAWTAVSSFPWRTSGQQTHNM